jgi:SAM-dependent methyltransferase
MWLSVIQDNLKACIPCKELFRGILRKVSPYHSLPANDQVAFEQGLQLVELTEKYKIKLDTVLEVGTGWVPTIPHMLKACGANRIILSDIERLCDFRTFSHAEDFVEKSLDRLSEVSAIEDRVLRKNLLRHDVEEYRCPPRLDELKNGSFDLVYSRTVLEHIPELVLAELLLEWRRLLAPGGFSIHFIDNSDHFEHRDKTLSRLNFLTLPDWAWKFACFNPQNYQNRLRHSDYLNLFRNAGYELLHVEGTPDAQALAALDHLVIGEKFAGYDKTDLAILTSVIVARKPIDQH